MHGPTGWKCAVLLCMQHCVGVGVHEVLQLAPKPRHNESQLKATREAAGNACRLPQRGRLVLPARPQIHLPRTNHTHCDIPLLCLRSLLENVSASDNAYWHLGSAALTFSSCNWMSDELQTKECLCQRCPAVNVALQTTLCFMRSPEYHSSAAVEPPLPRT